MPFFPLQMVRNAVRRTRRLPEYARRRVTTRLFRKLVLGGAPSHVATTGDVEVHTLLSRRALLEGIAALKSFYRFAPEPYPLIIHEDGSLSSDDAAVIQRHFPGVRIIRRDIADREVLSYLERRGLHRCAALRRQFVLAIKFFDLPYYARDRRVLYMDSDVLFLQPPSHLIAATNVAEASWRDRYAIDIHTCYSWPVDMLERTLGIRMLSAVNSGLLLLGPRPPDWSLAEECLALPAAPDRSHYTEQTLFAVELSRSGADALPPEYDVCFRYTWRDDYELWLGRAERGHEVIAQHYCGSQRQRAHFYSHFVRFVAPALDARHRVAREPHSLAGLDVPLLKYRSRDD